MQSVCPGRHSPSTKAGPLPHSFFVARPRRVVRMSFSLVSALRAGLSVSGLRPCHGCWPPARPSLVRFAHIGRALAHPPPQGGLPSGRGGLLLCWRRWFARLPAAAPCGRGGTHGSLPGLRPAGSATRCQRRVGLSPLPVFQAFGCKPAGMRVRRVFPRLFHRLAPAQAGQVHATRQIAGFG